MARKSSFQSQSLSCSTASSQPCRRTETDTSPMSSSAHAAEHFCGMHAAGMQREHANPQLNLAPSSQAGLYQLAGRAGDPHVYSNCFPEPPPPPLKQKRIMVSEIIRHRRENHRESGITGSCLFWALFAPLSLSLAGQPRTTACTAASSLQCI